MSFWLLLIFCVIWNGALIALFAILGHAYIATGFAALFLACFVHWIVAAHRSAK